MRTKRLSGTVFFAAVFLLPFSSFPGGGRKSYSEQELNQIYAKILCAKCGMKHTLQTGKCTMVPTLRALVKERLEQGFSPKEVIWNFNGDNVAFIHQLPTTVIRKVRCPCACGETLEVCIAELRPLVNAMGRAITRGCPVIEEIMGDIRNLRNSGYNNSTMISKLQDRRHRGKYETIISAAIKSQNSSNRFVKFLADLPDAVLDDVDCTCPCTETLRTCLLEMPWCTRVEGIISRVSVLVGIGLTTAEAASSVYAPCGKVCAKNTTGTYLGINCYSCDRPIRDEAFYGMVAGKKRAYCCQSCYVMDSPLPAVILDNVKCAVCPCGQTLRNCRCGRLPIQESLIKNWLMEGKTPAAIIERFREIHGN